jgi:hypothetical protein
VAYYFSRVVDVSAGPFVGIPTKNEILSGLIGITTGIVGFSALHFFIAGAFPIALVLMIGCFTTIFWVASYVEGGL